MDDQLKSAQSKVSSIRFSSDKEKKSDNLPHMSLDLVKGHINLFELRISDKVTPNLQKTLDKIAQIFHILPSTLECFVYASPQIQANCFLGVDDSCVLRFSSALIDLLDENEFAFVAGHEIGHFLLNHTQFNLNENSSLEYYMLQRYQEISADRVGLIACGSLNSAIKAMIKTTSGLSDRHLRYDVSSFISQLSSSKGVGLLFSTHPSMIIRCRALLWFSLSDIYLNEANNMEQTTLEFIDKKILMDFKKYVDGPASIVIEKAKETLSIWLIASFIVDQGTFTKITQEDFIKKYGSSTLKSMKNFFSSTPSNLLKDEVLKRIMVAKENLRLLIPESYEEVYNAILLKFTKGGT